MLTESEQKPASEKPMTQPTQEDESKLPFGGLSFKEWEEKRFQEGLERFRKLDPNNMPWTP